MIKQDEMVKIFNVDDLNEFLIEQRSLRMDGRPYYTLTDTKALNLANANSDNILCEFSADNGDEPITTKHLGRRYDFKDSKCLIEWVYKELKPHADYSSSAARRLREINLIASSITGNNEDDSEYCKLKMLAYRVDCLASQLILIGNVRVNLVGYGFSVEFGD